MSTFITRFENTSVKKDESLSYTYHINFISHSFNVYSRRAASITIEGEFV